jgi:hypothetical protein
MVPASACEGDLARADLLTMGRALMRVNMERALNAIAKVGNDKADAVYAPSLTPELYNRTNETFSRNRLMFAANRFRAMVGQSEITDYDEFRRNSMQYYGNPLFYQVLGTVDQEIVTPVLPATYSEAVSLIADVHECEIGNAVEIDIGSNFIPLFQDSSWGAAQSVPKETFYNKPITLIPQPKTATISMKWTQLIGNKIDFGRFYSNLAAGMFSKTMAQLVSAFVTASQVTTLVPSNMQTTFSDVNYATLANLVAAQNGVPIGNITTFGGYVAATKVLPTQALGSSGVEMDAALAMLLGVDYQRTGYLGYFKGTRVMALQDAIVPGTQNTAPATVLPTNRMWMFASNGLKPMAVAVNSGTPISLEYTPERTADLTVSAKVTMTLATSAIFGAKLGTYTI